MNAVPFSMGNMLEDKASMRIRNDVTRRKILTILKMRTRRRALKGGSDGMDSV